MDPPERVFTPIIQGSNVLATSSLWLLVVSCFSQTGAGVSFLYDSEFDLTHTLKKMEEQLLKFAVNVLFNRFDLLVRSHRRASVAIYCGVAGTGVTAWISLGSHGGGDPGTRPPLAHCHQWGLELPYILFCMSG